MFSDTAQTRPTNGLGPGQSGESFGVLLRLWRQRRGFSQSSLALEAGVSQRHISFLESGRSSPSREMALGLAQTLDMPLREQNRFLLAAGFAARFHQRGLDDPALGLVTKVLQQTLDRHEPYPAMVINAHHELLIPNKGAMRFLGMFLAPEAIQNLTAKGTINVAQLMLEPSGLRPFVEDWESVARPIIARMAQEMHMTGDIAGQALVRRLCAIPGVPSDWRTPKIDTLDLPVLTFSLRKGPLRVSFLTTLTTLGTPQDITLHELRIECFYPADAATEAAFR